MSARHHYLSLGLLLMVGTGAIVAASALAFAQDGSHTMPGHAAFGTIQEIVRILEADPATD